MEYIIFVKKKMNINVIFGTLLGDSWIYKDKRGFYSFRFSQSNKEYALWKADLLELPYYIHERNRFDKRTDREYYSCDILIKLEHNIKKEIHNLFYSPVKIVNYEILNNINDQALAVWYLDDGNVYYNGNICHITLAVNGFTLEERTLIVNWFKDKYNLEFKHTGKAIRLTSRKECENFMKLVEQYIPECMNYKILNNEIRKYRETKG